MVIVFRIFFLFCLRLPSYPGDRINLLGYFEDIASWAVKLPASIGIHSKNRILTRDPWIVRIGQHCGGRH